MDRGVEPSQCLYPRSFGKNVHIGKQIDNILSRLPFRRLPIWTVFGSIGCVYIAIMVQFYSMHLDKIAQQIKANFVSQNYQDLGRSNIFDLSMKLTSLASSIDWVCITGEKNGVIFFERIEGSCSSGLFQKQVIISNMPSDDLKIQITVKTAGPLKILFIWLSFVTVMFVAIVTKIVLVWQKEKNRLHTDFAEKAKQMAHDLRSPLSALKVMVAKERNVDFENRELLQKVFVRLSKIADEFLTYSRRNNLSITKKLVARGPFNGEFSESIFRLVDLMDGIKAVLDEKKIEFTSIDNLKLSAHFDVYDSNAKYQGDLDQLMRIVSNLLNNSIESLSEKTKLVSVTLGQESGSLLLEIRDTGKGIPTEIIAKLGHESVTYGKRTGNGLALKNAFTNIQQWAGEMKILPLRPLGTLIVIRLNSHRIDHQAI